MASGLGRGEVICVVAIALIKFSSLILAQTPSAPIEAKASQPVPTSDSPILKSLESVPSALRLREWHDLLGGEPHVAGTDGDAREIRRIDLAFRKMGLMVETHEFWPLLSKPISARVEIVDKTDDADANPTAPSTRRGVLSVIEKNLAEDPAAAHSDLTWGWNAYSASGDITCEVVPLTQTKCARNRFERLEYW